MKERKRPGEPEMSYETAENTLDILLDYYEVYFDEITSEKERDNVKGACEAIINYIRVGYINISETKKGDILVSQKLKRAAEGAKQEALYDSCYLTKAKVQMKNATNDDGYGKLYALMGSLSGNGSAWIKNLKGIDYKVMEALSVLFLQCTSG
jgi:hypothetical protein